MALTVPSPHGYCDPHTRGHTAQYHPRCQCSIASAYSSVSGSARTAEATVLAGCIRALNPCAVQDYRGSFPSDEAALQGWLKTAQPKTWPKDGDWDTIWNGKYGKDQRTKPGDISLM